MATTNSSRPQTFSLAKTSATNYGQCSGKKADQCNVHFALCPPEGQQAEVKQALVCPSIYPYLLTLRGGNLQKDLVLYPLKTSVVTIFGAPVAGYEGFSASDRRVSSQGHEDLVLHASDLLQPHCRLHILPPSPADPRPGSSRARAARYGYSLLVEVLSSRAPVFLNGRRVEAGKEAAEVRPGDLLGVGLRYLFLFKDPTGGQDVPDCLPWYPAPPDHHRAQLSPWTAEEEPQEPASERRCSLTTLNLAVDDSEAEEKEYCALADCESIAGKSLELPYPQDREEEVLNYIASISCSSPADFPHTTAVLLLGCHAHVSRRRPASHQALFFVRLLNAVRSRVNEVSRVLSMQKYHSNLYAPSTLDSQQDDALREGDPLLELLCWLSNLLSLHGHVTSAPFRCRLATLPDVTSESVEELKTSLEEMVRFLFQQSVYSVTKVLFSPLSQILQLSDTSPAVGMERVLHVLRTTLDVSEDVSLHRDVTVQLLIYLLFFVTTTLFNKLMAKGAGSQCFCWGTGERLRDSLAQLQDWAASLGLEAHYGALAQRLAALVDLLATPPHTLLRMDWSAFRRQYWTLSESQLHRVLAEYQFPDGQSAPASWDPPSGMHTSQDVTISLSSHPPFLLPSDPSRVDHATTFPPPLYRHLHDVISRFSDQASFSHRTPDKRDSEAEGMPSAAPFLSLPSHAPSSFSTASALLSSPSPSSPPGTSCPSSQHSRRSDSIPLEHRHYSPGSGEAVNKGLASSPRTSAGRGSDGDGPELLSRTPPLPPRWSDSSDSPPPRPPKPRSPPGVTIPAALPPDENSSGSVSSARIADTSSPSPETQERYGGLVHNDNNVDSEQDRRSSDCSDSVMDPLSTIFSSWASSPKLAGTGKVKSRRIAGISVSERRDCHSCKCHRLPSVFASVVGQADLSQPCDKTSGRPRQSPNSLPQSRRHLNKTLQHQDSSDLQEQVLERPQTSVKARRERRNKKAAGIDLVLIDYHHRTDPPPPYPRAAYAQNDPALLSRHGGDPRRRPITKVLLGSNQDVKGTLSLQDKRPVNNVSPLMIGLSPPHQVTDSIVSDDSLSPNLADLSLALEFTSPVSSLSKRVVAAGAIPNEANSENMPDVKTETHKEDVTPVNTNTDKFPDDVYIDVAVQATLSHTVGNIGNSDSTQLDVPRVRYLHRMPQEKDASSKGDITGEVFTLTLLKESSRLGMGLIDGMYTALKLPGIYVRNVLPGTPAALCGHIRVGDRILAVNGQSIVGTDYSSATKMIRDSGPTLDLLIAKCDRSVTACISAS